jgi:hypothetical protein
MGSCEFLVQQVLINNVPLLLPSLPEVGSPPWGWHAGQHEWIFRQSRALKTNNICLTSLTRIQCSGSMPFWGWIRIRGSMPLTNRSGSGSCYFCHWPSRCQQKLIFNTIFSAYYFLKVHLHHFSMIKSQKESQNRRNQGFSYYFCMMIEGSGSVSIPLTSGSESGSRRPKNMWIRIRNTARIHRQSNAVMYGIL